MRKSAYILLCLVATAFMLSGCSVSLLNSLLVSREGYTVRKDIPYGTDARQRLDIYVPDHLTKPAPVIVFFYGGSWQGGSKDDYLFVGQAFASRGYVTVIADYRVYPQVRYPVFIEDSASAFVFTHAHIGDYGGDAGRLYLAGHSAGAYNAVMLAADTTYLKEADGDAAWIKGVIGIAGPYDFLPLTDPKLIALFGSASNPEMLPITYVHKHMPPVFLATGDEDTTVLPRNTHHLTAKLLSDGDSVEKHVYPGVAHIGIALALADKFHYKAPLVDDIVRFIHKTEMHGTPLP